MAITVVNYVWMGKVPEGDHIDSFRNGPNDLAEKNRQLIARNSSGFNIINKLTGQNNELEITMWVPEKLIADIISKGLLDPSIKIKPIESVLDNTKYFSNDEVKDIKTTLELLDGSDKYKGAYAAQKDLVSYVLQEEKGGYFFDTTTKIDDPKKLIAKKPKDVAFPRLGNEGSIMFNGKEAILPDVWALYSSKPGKGVFKSSVESFTERYKYYFPENLVLRQNLLLGTRKELDLI